MSPFPVEPARALGPLRIVVTTYPSREAALTAVGAVLTGKLAACANVLAIYSEYRWKGRVESADESLVLFKTVPKRVGALMHYLEENHPYDVPEVLELDVPRVGPAYLRYLASTLDPHAASPPIGGRPTRRGAPRGRGGRRPGRTRGPRRRRSR